MTEPEITEENRLLTNRLLTEPSTPEELAWIDRMIVDSQAMLEILS